MKFVVKASAPKKRNVWKPDIAEKVQTSLFNTVAMIVAASTDAEAKLMSAIAAAKSGKLMFPVA